jgi:hypothetical protein
MGRCDVATEQRRNGLRPSTAKVRAVLDDALDEPCFRLATALLLIVTGVAAESLAKDARL